MCVYLGSDRNFLFLYYFQSDWIWFNIHVSFKGLSLVYLMVLWVPFKCSTISRVSANFVGHHSSLLEGLGEYYLYPPENFFLLWFLFYYFFFFLSTWSCSSRWWPEGQEEINQMMISEQKKEKKSIQHWSKTLLPSARVGATTLVRTKKVWTEKFKEDPEL